MASRWISQAPVDGDRLGRLGPEPVITSMAGFGSDPVIASMAGFG
jgi:hypothetical protein